MARPLSSKFGIPQGKRDLRPSPAVIIRVPREL